MLLLLPGSVPSLAVVEDEKSAQQSTQKDQHVRPFVPGQVLVKFKDTVNASAEILLSEPLIKKHKARKLAGLFIDRSNKTTAQAKAELGQKKRAARKAKRAAGPDLSIVNWYVVDVPPDANIETLVAELKADAKVETAQPNYFVKLQSFPQDPPNDPFFSSSNAWGQQYDDLWAIKKINAPEAWQQVQGEGMVVAVVDSGLDYDHPDIAANVWTNPNEIPNNNVDDDGNGYIDDNRGWNFAYGNNNVIDDNGHGTHVAGTIAAIGNNNAGVIGVAPKAKIMALKGFDSVGGGYISNLAVGLYYAADNGADVINNSWTCAFECPSDPVIEAAVQYAANAGVVVVFAAGNSNSDVSQISPQNMTNPKPIVVAATDRLDTRSDFSSFGVLVDVSAPGGDSAFASLSQPYVNILSLRAQNTDVYGDGIHIVNNEYYRARGTSMATPHVSGVAALILQKNPGFTVDDVAKTIRYAVDPVSSTQWIGQGRINLTTALQVSGPLPDAKIKTAGEVGGRINILGTAAGVSFSSYEIYIAPGNAPAGSWTKIHTGSQPVNDAVLLSNYDTGNLAEGTHTLKLVVYNTLGQSSYALSNINVRNFEITSPLKNDILRKGDIVSIKGFLRVPYSSYTVEYGEGKNPAVWSRATISLSAPPSGTSIDGEFAQWNTAVLPASSYPQGNFYTLRLTFNTANGQQQALINMLYLDDQLKPGWPQYLPADSRFLFFGGTGGALNVYVADLDLDGKKEIVTLLPVGPRAPSPPKMVIYNYDGTLRWSKDMENSAPFVPVIADIDGDQYPEILVSYTDANLNPFIGVFKYDGNNFVEYDGSNIGGDWPVPLEFLSSLSAADLNGDGKLEIIARYMFSVGNKKAIRILNHKGEFQKEILLPSEHKPDSTFLNHVAVGNLDNEPDLELVTRYGDDRLAVIKPDGRLLPGWPVQHGYIGGMSPVTGDIDHDGFDNVIATYRVNYPALQEAAVYAYEKDGRIMPGWPVLIPDTNESPILADLDQDGKLEIIASAASTVYVYDYRGRLLPGWPKLAGFQTGATKMSPTAADINADHYPDVIYPNQGFGTDLYDEVTQNSGGIFAWKGDAGAIDLNPSSNKNFLFRERMPVIEPSVIIDDVDQDGKVDVVSTSLIAEEFIPDPNDLSKVVGFRMKNRASIYVWSLGTAFDAAFQAWPTFMHDNLRSGRYATPAPPGPTLIASPASVGVGGQLSVQWRVPSGNARDWISIYRVGAPNSSYGWWQYTNGATTGTFTMAAPSSPGNYEFRYLINDGYTDLVRSQPVQVVGVPTLDFSAVPATVKLGESATLTWQSAQATGCTASQGWNGAKATSGTEAVAPTQTTVYRLACAGPGGTVTRDVSVTINMTSLTASPLTVAPGGNLTVQWSTAVANARDWISIYSVGASNTSYGWWQYTNGATTGTFTMTAPSIPGNYEFRYLVNNGYTDIARSQTIQVLQPPTLNFSAVPVTVRPGQSATLTWESINASECTASQGWSGAKATSGTQLVTPAQTTTYTLTCAGLGSTVTKAVVVTVSDNGLTALPTTVAPGGVLTVTWKVASGNQRDWISIYRIGAPNTSYGWWQYTNGALTGSLTTTAPTTPGAYEFRYLVNDGYSDTFRSGTIEVK